MKTKSQLKSIAFFLSILIILQSCTIYKGKGVSLERAVLEGDKAELVTNYGAVLKYKRIESKNGQYYGVKKVKREYVKDSIDPNDVKIVRLHNKTLSTLFSIGVPVLIIVGMITLAISTSDNSWPPITIPLTGNN